MIIGAAAGGGLLLIILVIVVFVIVIRRKKAKSGSKELTFVNPTAYTGKDGRVSFTYIRTIYLVVKNNLSGGEKQFIWW